MPTRKDYQHKYNASPKGRAAAARWRAKNPRYSQQWASLNKDKVRRIKQKHRYGVDPNTPRPDNCEACKRPFVETSKHHGLCVDHDHATGVVRGFICNDCNLALGYVQDSRDRLQLLINYLDKAELCR